MLPSEKIEDLIQEWHVSTSSLTLHEFLGLTKEEYASWVSRKESKMIGVYVGRFEPVHLGHTKVMETMSNVCSKYLGIIGSSNAPTSMRDFFSYVQRRRFIKEIFPNFPLVGLPDYHDDSQWLTALDDILSCIFDTKDVKKDVVFFGGSQEDLRFFLQDNRRIYVINRFDGVLSPKISSSEVRDDLLHDRSIEGKVHPKIINLVMETFTANWEVFKRQ